jgi:hypothetical protein
VPIALQDRFSSTGNTGVKEVGSKSKKQGPTFLWGKYTIFNKNQPTIFSFGISSAQRGSSFQDATVYLPIGIP